MSISIKITKEAKETLENLQSKLHLETNLKIDQYQLLSFLIEHSNQNFESFLSFLKGVKLTEEEINKLKTKYIKNYGHISPEKSDDELIYGI